MRKQKIIWKWRDAHTFGEWTDLEEAKKFAEDSWNNPNVSYGEKVFETKNYVVVAASKNTHGKLLGDLTMIPKSLLV